MTRQIIYLVLAGLALAGCNTVGIDKPQLAALDNALTKPCMAEPEVKATARQYGLSEREIVRLIGRYHIALADCSKRQSAIVRIYEKRDAQIGGRK